MQKVIVESGSAVAIDLYQDPELHDGEAADSDLDTSFGIKPLRSLPNSDFPLPTSKQENRTEAKFVAIGADQMWRMGYTGYGTRPDRRYPGRMVPILPAQSISFISPSTFQFLNPGDRAPLLLRRSWDACCGHDTGAGPLMEDTIGVTFNAQWMEYQSN